MEDTQAQHQEPFLLMETGQVPVDIKLILDIMHQFSDESVDIEAGIVALVLVAARAAHEVGISEMKFLKLCAQLRELAKVDDISKHLRKPPEA